MKREGIMRALRKQKQDLRLRFAVQSLALFGSAARDQAVDTSDVDLLVEFNRPIGLLHLIQTQQHLEKLLRVKRVDLVLRRCLIDELRDDVLREAIDVFPQMEVPAPSHP